MAALSKLSLGLIDPAFGLAISGTDLNDMLFGTANADAIYGLAGADVLYGYGGNDLLFGGDGNDTLHGGTGNDVLDGGRGNDMLVGGAGADALIGGEGYDTVSYGSAVTAVHVVLAGTGAIGDAQGDTYSGIEKVVGSRYGDTLIADDSGVVIDGGAGNDDIWGGDGLDVLNGGSGDDWIEGGLGLDVLTGGTGTDHFVFNWGDGPDIITDFQQGNDKIVLRDGFEYLPFGTDGELLTGTELPAWQGGLPQGGHPGRDRLFYDNDDYQLYHVDAHGEATLLVAFSTAVQLQTSDFII